MIELDLMLYVPFLKVRTEKNKRYIHDGLRNKWYTLQPEELVRQLMIHYLVHEKSYNKNRISVERGFSVHGKTANSVSKRFDLLVYDPAMQPYLLVECKAPHIEIDPQTFWQVDVYSLAQPVQYVVLTNGRATYCLKVDYQRHTYDAIQAIPAFPTDGNLENIL